MKKVLYYLQKCEDSILIVTFIIMVLASFAQVLNRNIFHLGISWFEEISRYCMIYMALLAAEAGLRDGTQISITAVTEKMNKGLKHIVYIISKVIVIAFSSVIFITSFDLLKVQLVSGQTSPGLKIPMVVPYFALPLSFGIIILVQVALLIITIRNSTNKKEIVVEEKV